MNETSIQFFYEGLDPVILKPEEYISWILLVGKHHEKTCGQINYIFCTDNYLLEINKKYLDHDYYTDVISFPYDENPVSGDIFISVDRVRDNAQTLGLEFEKELNRVMVHGFLHFLGYEDHNDQKKTQMRNLENEMLALKTP